MLAIICVYVKNKFVRTALNFEKKVGRPLVILSKKSREVARETGNIEIGPDVLVFLS